MAAMAAASSSLVIEVPGAEVLDYNNCEWYSDTVFRAVLTSSFGVEESSFTSKRFDMAPLCMVMGPAGVCFCVDSECGITFPAAPIYIDALPFPGRAAGKRLTMTDEERGMIWESSFNSERCV